MAPIWLQRNLELQQQIAVQIGISIAEFSEPLEAANEDQGSDGAARQGEIALSRDCTDLVEAFVRIADPQERLHCLQIVRDAAKGK